MPKNQNKAQFVILRGIPGSGKSTYAKKAFPGYCRSSADNFFEVEGHYKFDPKKLGEAHQACFRQAVGDVLWGDNVVIDNTNTQVWEIAPYLQLAQSYGYEVRIIRVTCDPEVAAKRNIHGVSQEAVNRMWSRMEPLLPFWPNEEVIETEGEEE